MIVRERTQSGRSEHLKRGRTHSMSPQQRLRLAILLVLLFLGTGTLGYMILDGYPPLDAFFMTVITLSTVGYGEIHPLSGAGRLFTVLLILWGVGSIAFAAGAFTEIIIERAANPNRWKKSMERRIGRLKGHIIICGHGRVGAAAAEYFRKKGASFVVVENSGEQTRRLIDLGYEFLQGDATRELVLLKAGIKRASALLAVLNADPENLFTVLTARELNPVLRIIARTEDMSSQSRMLRAGADSVISPFVAAGQSVAESLLGGDFQEFTTDWGREERMPSWVDVAAQPGLAGRPLLDVQDELRAKIVGLRRDAQDLLLPEEDTVIAANDHLLVLGREQKSRTELQVKAAQPKKVVFIDDNPVILRLYTRLFQKAGFNIICAASGQEGLTLIQKESPDCVVVDYHLPDVSGLDVCRRVRELGGTAQPKLFLFTAVDESYVREKALAEGVDEVVVKSPEASEIVNTVREKM